MKTLSKILHGLRGRSSEQKLADFIQGTSAEEMESESLFMRFVQFPFTRKSRIPEDTLRAFEDSCLQGPDVGSHGPISQPQSLDGVFDGVMGLRFGPNWPCHGSSNSPYSSLFDED